MSSQNHLQELSQTRDRTSSHTRWIIAGLLFAVAVVNYFDRQSLPTVAPQLQAELHLSDRGYAHIVSLFLGASAVAYALAGFISDRLGARKAMVLFVGFWSIAEASTAFVNSAVTLGLARFCLGLGEPGLWVAAPKAVGEIFRKEERSLAIGIYTMGASIGAVIALPIINLIIRHFPWRSVFVIDGAFGLLWIPFWLLSYRTPPIATDTLEAVPDLPKSISPTTLQAVLRHPATPRLVVARAITDPVWYFFLFWFPKFLGSRGMNSATIAQQGWTVYLFAGIGTIAGGLLSRQLIRRGTRETFAYRTAMLAAAVLMPLSPLCALAASNTIAVSVACIIAFAHMAWLVTLTALIVRLYSPNEVGKATGLIAAGSGLGGLVSSELIGMLVGHHGYTPVFVVMAFLHPIALGLLWKIFRHPKNEYKDLLDTSNVKSLAYPS